MELTDREVGFIQQMLIKVDPASMMLECQDLLKRIQEYARQKQQEQMADSAEAQFEDG